MNTKYRHTKWATGPGGWKCPCCGPLPKERKKARRTERRVTARKVAREIAAG